MTHLRRSRQFFLVVFILFVGIYGLLNCRKGMITMLLTKEVEVTLAGKNIIYYENLGYEIPRKINKSAQYGVPRGTRITIKVEDLYVGAHTEVEVLCDKCKEVVFNKPYRDYLTQVERHGANYCKECGKYYLRDILVERYGVNSAFELDWVQKKKKQSLFKKFGVENSLESVETREKIKKTNLEKYGVDNIFKSKDFKKNNSGENHYNWQGGITPQSNKDRNSIKYKEWRLVVFTRDKYTCQCCGKTGGYLNAHHIFCFSDYPQLRFVVENGISLCKSCHSQILQGSFHQIYGTHNNNYEQLKQYIGQKTGGEWNWLYIHQII